MFFSIHPHLLFFKIDVILVCLSESFHERCPIQPIFVSFKKGINVEYFLYGGNNVFLNTSPYSVFQDKSTAIEIIFDVNVKVDT